MQHAATMDLLDRDTEVTELDRLVEAAIAGRGRVALVEGPPGIGKTRLLDLARVRAREKGMTALSARASELDRDFPFGVVRQLFEPLVARAPAPRRAELLRGAAELAGDLLGAPVEAAGSPAGVDPSLAHFHALYWLAANLADENPLVLLVDDLHWADASSLRFLAFLSARLDELPVLVVAAARLAEPGADRRELAALAADARTVVLRPGPLADASVAALVADALGADPDPGFRDACRTATGGNPFLLGELLQELAAGGVVPDADRVAMVHEVAPPSVARAVLVRLARLGDDAVALARALAVIGDRTPLRRACAVAGVDEARGDDLAVALAGAHVLDSRRPLAFAHPLLRSAVYSDMQAGERARLHRRAADVLAADGESADAIAVHLLASEPAGDTSVVATLREAAWRSFGRGAAQTAVAFLRRALEEPVPAAERGTVLLELASKELHAGDPDAAVEHFDEGMRRCDDPRVRATYVGEHVVALQAVGRSGDAPPLVEGVVAELANVDARLALSVEASMIASGLLDRARRPWARERLERHRGRLTLETIGERKLSAVLAHLDAFAGDQPAAELAEAAERALARGGLADEFSGRATPFYSAVNVLVLADRIDAARRPLDEAVESVRRRGSSPWWFAAVSGWRAWFFARQGALAEAEADAHACAELALEHGWFAAAPPMLGFVLGALLDRGEVDDAERILERSGMATRPPDDDVTFDGMVHARARIHAARGRVDAGRADLAALARRRSRWNTFPTLVPAPLIAPELAGEPVDELARAERMLGEGRAWGTARAVGMALHALGLAHGGTRGIDLLREAAATLERSPARVEHARALADLGAALRRANQRTTAREALDIAHACGATPLFERTRHELRAAGGRPRRPRTTGSEALTASERRIAAMAADGLSNPEIAQALFVTRKTVEAHLGSAYRKLGIRSRAELAGALSRR